MFNRRIYCVSNAHLDTQWNWTIQDTIRDCVKNTMDVNFENIDNTRHYVMNFEGAFRYKLMREYYPEKYEMLKKYIRDGRWNVAGSFWDSCDVNVPSSEGLMRQALLGNKYFEEEFGKRSYDIFLPDCFGFRSSIPSIAAHMGIKGFSTQKLAWGVGTPIINDDGTTSIPMPGDFNRMDLGKWEGPDGRRIYVSLDAGGYTYQFDEKENRVTDKEYFYNYTERNLKNSGYPWHAVYFGTGDYGGGCSLECAKALDAAVEKEGGLYDVVASSTTQIFEDVEANGDEALPVYKGPLNIPHGFGALTSHTISKRWNRRCELLADAAERASLVAELETGKEYPEERLKEAWKTFLWHQFHDDLTGTSICEAYTFSHNDYIIALNTFANELGASVEAVASVLDTTGIGTPVVIYNPTGTKRCDTVTVNLTTSTGYARVYDEKGNEVPSQVSSDGKSVIYIANVLPISFTVYEVRESDSAYSSSLSASKNTIENERYKVTVDENGDVSSVYDKEYSREMLSSPICMQISESNSPNWPSWELGYEDTKKEPIFVRENVSVTIGENGGALVSLVIKRSSGKSSFTQTVSLASGSSLVRFDNYVEWYNTNSLLKANFPLSVSSPYAEFDLGLGADKLGNSNDYPYFQYCVHQWADLTDDASDYGISIFNDCKYGMDKPSDNTLRLTLIHTPSHDYSMSSRQSWQDMGRNEFAFAIVGHAGDRSGMAALAEGFNSPLMPFESDKHEGKSRVISAVSKCNDDILVKAFKKEYTSLGCNPSGKIVLRLQETMGRPGSASVSLAYPVKAVCEVNGYEEYKDDASYDDGRLVSSHGIYEPKTYLFELDTHSEYVSPFTKIELPYDKKITSSNEDKCDTDVEISIPEELFESSVVAFGVPYTLGDKKCKNALSANGQTIALPCNARYAYVLATSLSGDRKAYFSDTEVTVNDAYENVGTWDMLGAGCVCRIKREPIALFYTHTHTKEADRLYKFAYVFAYKIPVSDGKLNLPSDENILVLAVTASADDKGVNELYPLYDVAEKSQRPHYTLTVNGASGSGVYEEGSRVFIGTESMPADAIFERYEGADFAITRGTTAMLILKKDTVVNAIYRPLGENLLLKKPCYANGEMDESEAASMAVSGDLTEKWCTDADENGVCWLVVDMGSVNTIGRWYVVHCGICESPSWNTSDFELQYKLSEDDEWKTADKVEENKMNTTVRDFSPVKARYLRLYITKACVRHGNCARIYNFAVFPPEA